MIDGDDGLTPVPEPRHPPQRERAEGDSVEGALGEVGAMDAGGVGLALLGIAGAIWLVRRAIRRLAP